MSLEVLRYAVAGLSASALRLGGALIATMLLSSPAWALKAEKASKVSEASRAAAAADAPAKSVSVNEGSAPKGSGAELQLSAAKVEDGEASAAAPAQADDPASVQPVQGTPDESAAALSTLQQIMAKVWRDNPEVIQAERVVQASGYDVTTARAGYLPYAQLQTSKARKSADSATTLYIVLPLWSGGSTNAQVDIAKAKQRAALAELARTRWDIGQRTLEAYFNVAQAQDQLIQWNNYVGALSKLQETIQRRAEQGVAPQADVETAVSRIRQAQASLESTRANLMTNRAQLASLLNLQPGSVAWPEDSFLLSDEEVGKAKEGVEKHPNHLAARAQIEIQQGTARGSLASLWPSLSLQYHKQLEGVQFDPTNDATLLVAQMQTGNGLQGALGYRAEKQRLVALEAKLDAVDRQVAAMIDVDRTQLRALAMQLRVQFEAAQAASNLIESFVRQFEAGRKSWLEVLNAQREANDLLVQSVSLRRNYWYANAKLALDSMNWERLGVKIVGDAGDGEEVKQ